MPETTTLIPERLQKLDDLTLDSGGHRPGAGCFCFNEAVAWLAGEDHTARPACESPVLTRFTTVLNDRWSDEDRQLLKPYLTRVVGTGDDGKDPLRVQIATKALCEQLLGPWLRLAGMDARADELAAAKDLGTADLRALLGSISSEAWRLSGARYDQLPATVKAKVREHLADRAVAVADAAAAAAAAAAAVAVAVAVAVADAVAVAVAAAEGGVVDWWGEPYDAAYKAARAHYAGLPAMARIAELAAAQRRIALQVLDAMIDPVPVSA